MIIIFFIFYYTNILYFALYKNDIAFITRIIINNIIGIKTVITCLCFTMSLQCT